MLSRAADKLDASPASPCQGEVSVIYDTRVVTVFATARSGAARGAATCKRLGERGAPADRGNCCQPGSPEGLLGLPPALPREAELPHSQLAILSPPRAGVKPLPGSAEKQTVFRLGLCTIAHHHFFSFSPLDFWRKIRPEKKQDGVVLWLERDAGRG